MQNKKIMVLGATGYFGGKFVEYFRARNCDVNSSRVNILDTSDILAKISEYKPDIVINAAGKTGRPNVDWCEDHKSETIASNVNGALNVACVTSDLGIPLVHLGSGCIYDGDNNGKGFSESDEPNFFGSFYSRTKLYSEKLLMEFPHILQLRIRIPVEGVSSPKNVIDKLLKYEKIISVDNSFTVVEDFFPASEKLIDLGATGIFNMTNVGSMDHEYLMKSYTQIVDPSRKFTVMNLDELYQKFAKALRSNTVLNTDKREALGVHMPEIHQRTLEILEDYKKNKETSKISEAVAV